jgi:hypothetical protein
MTRKFVALSERKPEHKDFRYVMATLDGRPCCASDDPENMCDECAATAKTPTTASDCKCGGHKPKAMHFKGKAETTVESTSRALMLDKIREARSIEAKFAQVKDSSDVHPGLLDTLKAAARKRAESLGK